MLLYGLHGLNSLLSYCSRYSIGSWLHESLVFLPASGRVVMSADLRREPNWLGTYSTVVRRTEVGYLVTARRARCVAPADCWSPSSTAEFNGNSIVVELCTNMVPRCLGLTRRDLWFGSLPRAAFGNIPPKSSANSSKVKRNSLRIPVSSPPS